MGGKGNWVLKKILSVPGGASFFKEIGLLIFIGVGRYNGG